MHDMRMTLPLFSIPAQDDRMDVLAPKDWSLSETGRWMRRRSCLIPKVSNLQLRAPMGPRWEIPRRSGATCLKLKACNRPLGVGVSPRSVIPRRSGATGSSAVWVRAGSDGFILPTMMNSIAQSPSRCRTLNASPILRMWRRFSNEARILARLDHPNIVPVYRRRAHRRWTLLRRLQAHRRQ